MRGFRKDYLNLDMFAEQNTDTELKMVVVIIYPQLIHAFFSSFIFVYDVLLQQIRYLVDCVRDVHDTKI